MKLTKEQIYYKIFRTIVSCKNQEQLDLAQGWASRTIYNNERLLKDNWFYIMRYIVEPVIIDMKKHLERV